MDTATPKSALPCPVPRGLGLISSSFSSSFSFEPLRFHSDPLTEFQPPTQNSCAPRLSLLALFGSELEFPERKIHRPHSREGREEVLPEKRIFTQRNHEVNQDAARRTWHCNDRNPQGGKEEEDNKELCIASPIIIHGLSIIDSKIQSKRQRSREGGATRKPPCPRHPKRVRNKNSNERSPRPSNKEDVRERVPATERTG